MPASSQSTFGTDVTVGKSNSPTISVHCGAMRIAQVSNREHVLTNFSEGPSTRNHISSVSCVSLKPDSPVTTCRRKPKDRH